MKKICLRCGCNSFISDRSLGGRIVCKRCGSSSIGYMGYEGFLSLKNKNFLYLMIIVVVVFVIIIL